jgi:presqualene diphosphate synthase
MNIQTQSTDGHAPAAKRAGGSSFYLAMRILGREQREAMFEIYSFCRAVDDIADGDAPRAERQALLAEWRKDIEGLYAGSVRPGLENLARTVARYSLRQENFLEVIDGMEMDAVEDIRAPDWTKLTLYCDRVACAVGRLSVRVFGMNEADGLALAHHLGQALQLTNILRDIDEDAGIGRLYLPREALQAAGIETTDLAAVVTLDLSAACAPVAARARNHYAEASRIMAKSARRIVRAPRIMGEVYRRILEAMAVQGWAPPRIRVHIQKPYLLWIALRHAFI